MENSNELTPQQYRKYNGQSVLSALRSIGREASAEELTKYIGKSIGQSEDEIKPEVEQVLRRGILNGFLVRKGKNYSLSGQDNIIDIDAPKKRRRISFSHENAKKKLSDSESEMTYYERPVSRSSNKNELKLISGGLRNRPRNVLESSSDDSTIQEDEQRPDTSSSSEEEPEHQAFISFLKRHRQ